MGHQGLGLATGQSDGQSGRARGKAALGEGDGGQLYKGLIDHKSFCSLSQEQWDITEGRAVAWGVFPKAHFGCQVENGGQRSSHETSKEKAGAERAGRLGLV